MLKKPFAAGRFLRYFLLLTCLFYQLYEVNAQCAGEDGAITVCNVADPSSQAVNLFAALGGAPEPGGVWTDPLQTGALNFATGMLDVWDIHFSGTFTFYYTVYTEGCADNVSAVSVTIGGYSGAPSPDGSACDDDLAVNLFHFFIGIMPDPQLNGQWTELDGTDALTGNNLNATLTGLGTFRFMYTMPAIGSCPPMSSTVSVTVYRKPNPGTATDLVLCSTDDLTQYSSFNLTSHLAGEDNNGLWSEGSTSELSGMFDPIIDVAHIYETLGPGTYPFSYTVYPTNPVCDIKTATISVIIEEPLDFTGATLVIDEDICEDELDTATFTATFGKGPNINPDGPYIVTYEIVSSSGTLSFNYTGTFSDGMMTFPIDKDHFPEAGDYTVRITNIVYTLNEGVCENIIDVSDILHIYPVPEIDEATLTIPAVCQGSDVVVQLTGDNNLADGTYELNYVLTGANTVSTQTLTISVISGEASFTIPAALVPAHGSTTIRITLVRNILTECEKPSVLSKSFTINPVVTIDPDLSVNDICRTSPLTAVVTGLGTLTDIDISISITGVNSVATHTVNVTASNGSAVVTLPASLVQNVGTSTATVTIISNHVTGCPAVFDPVSDNFTVNEIPSAPTAGNQSFCSASNAKVSDLVPSGPSVDWFQTAESTTTLSPDTLLEAGSYYASQRNDHCSSERTMIVVDIVNVNIPVLIADGENFCGIDNPTIGELSANVSGQEPVRWYDAENGGNELPETHLLEDNATYFGFGEDNVSDCSSATPLVVTVALTACDENPYDFFIPDGFSPNSDSVNDVWRIPEIEYLFPGYTYEIYNRYGSLMFKGNINKPSWDGRNYESKPMLDGIVPNGIYYYILNFNRDNAPAKQGYLYLNR